MRYRICKNGNGKHKIQYRFCFMWRNLRGPQWNTRTFKTRKNAELYIEKMRDDEIREKINKRKENDWQCEGEYYRR